MLADTSEGIAIDGKASTESWNAHTNGTMSLIKYRGETLLQTDFGQRIYIQVATNIRSSCAQRATHLPANFLELDRQMRPLLETKHPMVSWWPIMDKAIDLQVMIEGEHQTNETALQYSDILVFLQGPKNMIRLM
jgi:hypothetical protein